MEANFDKSVEEIHLGVLPEILRTGHCGLLYSNFLHLAFKMSSGFYYHLPAFARNAIFIQIVQKYPYFYLAYLI